MLPNQNRRLPRPLRVFTENCFFPVRARTRALPRTARRYLKTKPKPPVPEGHCVRGRDNIPASNPPGIAQVLITNSTRASRLYSLRALCVFVVNSVYPIRPHHIKFHHFSDQLLIPA